ncbi:MAG TPA: TetR/AcrR family transcriptional regulator [Gemmatimonadales bacterium]|nr:TetR/AcrR family transcriptional regulator [Gemmatimonadales bacterium]
MLRQPRATPAADVELCPRSPRWQRRPAERRREIIDAAVSTFGRCGFERATLADVAERAGVCPGTVSHYFGSKGGLFQAVIAERFVGFIAQEEALLADEDAPTSATVRLDQMLRRLWEHTWSPGTLELIQVTQVDSADFPESGRLLCRELSGRWRRLMGATLETGIRSGEFRRVDSDVTARIIGYTVLGVAQKVSAFAPYDADMPSREATWKVVRELVHRYVKADGTLAHRKTANRASARTPRKGAAARTRAEDA